MEICKSFLKTPLTELDVSGCSKLTYLECYCNDVKIINVSNCPKLVDLYIDDYLFLENKIIGLEDTSIVRLDCRGGDLLIKSQDPQFIWDVFVRKYNFSFPEVKLLDISDLDELARQVNKETIKDEEFLKKIGDEEFVKEWKGDYYWILDQLANSILARCLVIQNRLYDKKDEEYEKYLIDLAHQSLRCHSMNPKHPQASLYSTRERLVNQALNGDKELLSKLQDLPYLKEEFRLKD